MDSMVVELPLSIIYAASEAVQKGHRLKLVDLRVENGSFEDILGPYLDQGVRLVGISVMTGNPLKNAREISLFIRKHYPHVPIVWGGPHVTVIPETMNEPFLDYLVRGFGARPLEQLIAHLKTGSPTLESISGLSYRTQRDLIVHNPRSVEFERIHYSHIPYDMINVDSPHYRRLYKGDAQRLFSIFTTVGCPYKCTFCISPTLYEVIKGKKWLGDPEEEVIEHIEMLIARYQASHITVIDDTSFVSIKRMQRIFERILERNIIIHLEFRGARINEVDKMDDYFLDLMARVGVRVLQIGVETMSQRMLDLFEKNITKEQIFRVNRNLARHPNVKPVYNFLFGAPGETYADLLETKEGILQLLRENPQAYVGFGGDWKPVPGSKLLDVAITDYHYCAPVSLDDWIQVDTSDATKKLYYPWYTPRQNNLIKFLQVSSFVIDDKMVRESHNNHSPLFIILRLMARTYKPIALLRMKFDFYDWMFEYALWQITVRFLAAQTSRGSR